MIALELLVRAARAIIVRRYALMNASLTPSIKRPFPSVNPLVNSQLPLFTGVKRCSRCKRNVLTVHERHGGVFCNKCLEEIDDTP